MNFNKLKKTIQKNNPYSNLNLIEKAYLVAEKAHAGQKRFSKEDYIQHPLKTAEILANLKADDDTIAAGLLHDVIDDTPLTVNELKKEFGKEISFLVDGVTKLGKIKYHGIERQVENLRKILLAMTEDIRVILIKLADRLHNIQTLDALAPIKRKRIALETLEIYAPIAYRLGMRQLSGPLEDLSFKYAYPNEYLWLMNSVRRKYKQRQKYLDIITPLVEKELKKEKIAFKEIHSRAKRYWSLYKKLKKYDMDFNKIYDLVALRIIVENIESCYAALGVLHKRWKPLSGRIRDYIALSKPNGYQSLHTTVVCEDGLIVEIQIRTPEMHNKAEFGIAAHWLYQEKGKPIGGAIANDKELKWVNQLREWQKETEGSPKEFLQSLKTEFFQERIYVFTPQGEVIDLPEQSTPLDFAYSIHTDLGHHCQGAKADGKLISFNTFLRSGQVVEIIKSKEIKVNQNWLNFVKTSQAKNKIRNWLNKNKTTLPLMPKSAPVSFPPKNISIGKKQHKKSNESCWINVGGQNQIAVRFAQCCTPAKKQPICAYISKKGISIHRTDCKQIKEMPTEKILPANWQNIKK